MNFHFSGSARFKSCPSDNLAYTSSSGAVKSVISITFAILTTPCLNCSEPHSYDSGQIQYIKKTGLADSFFRQTCHHLFSRIHMYHTVLNIRKSMLNRIMYMLCNLMSFIQCLCSVCCNLQILFAQFPISMLSSIPLFSSLYFLDSAVLNSTYSVL